jgi:hypothetical protein
MRGISYLFRFFVRTKVEASQLTEKSLHSDASSCYKD